MNDTATIQLVDDEPDLRRALGRLLSTEGFEVTEHDSGEAFLEAMRRQRPFGCVLMDVAMPGLDGLATQREMLMRGIRLPVVFLTGQGGLPESVKAIKAGAVDFLAKPVRREPLLEALRTALLLAAQWRDEDAALEALRERTSRLTPRELEVLAHVIAGRLNKLIAERLGTSEQTIKVHRGRVMDKLQAKSVADLVRMAAALGIEPAE